MRIPRAREVSGSERVLARVSLLLAVGCADGRALESASPAEGYVVNGRVATEADLRGVVAVVDPVRGLPYCTGTAVTPRLVVTAAHCLSELDAYGEPLGALSATARVAVVAGALNVRPVDPSALVPSMRLARHPGYGPPPTAHDVDGFGPIHDIGFIVLARPLDYPPVPILPESARGAALAIGQTLQIAGYGLDPALGRESVGRLRAGDVSVTRTSPYELLAGGPRMPDTCVGDSGGPAFVTWNGQRYLAGVTSRGVATSQVECGDGAIYTAASAYIQDIEAETGEDVDVAAPPPVARGDAGPAYVPPTEDEPGATAPPGGCAALPATSAGASPALVGTAALVSAFRRSRRARPRRSRTT